MSPENTPQTVGNCLGYLCPQCGNGDSLYITASVSVCLLANGTDATDSDTEWDGSAPAWCGCGWTGKVNEFAQAETFEEE
jgi:hypothetical protein